MNIKRIWAIILAVVITTGMTVPAYATDTDKHKDGYTGTFSTDVSSSFSLSEDSVCTNDGEILFGAVKIVNGQVPFEEYAKQHIPNTVGALYTYDIKNSTNMNLQIDRCGVAIEQSTTDSLEISHIGVTSDTPEINSVVTIKADGTVNVSADGTSKLKYVNIDQNNRVNVALIKIPKHIKTLTIDIGKGILLVTNFAGAINGEVDNGSARIIGDNLDYGYDLECDNGSIRLEGGTVGGKISLKADSGSLKIFGTTVSGDINMKSGNGKVNVSAENLGGAVLETDNGKIELDVGTFTSDVNTIVGNGKLIMNVRKNPVDLSLVFGDIKYILPNSWNGQTVFGTGSPKVSLVCGNGEAEVTDSATPTLGDTIPLQKIIPKDKTEEMETLTIKDNTYYLVFTEKQLRDIASGKYGMDKKYMQQADIDLSSDEWVPIGTADNPFTGSYSGNGFKINGLTMKYPNAKLVGLFGYANEASLYNIVLRDLDIEKAGSAIKIKSMGAICANADGCKIYDNEIYNK